MSDAPKFTKVAVAMPYYKQIEGITALCGMGMAAYSASFAQMLFIECKGCYIEDNRNGAVEYALETGIDFDRLLWIDGDMQFPASALHRLLADDPIERFHQMPPGWTGRKDIVGANYRQRTPPYAAAGHYHNLDDRHMLEPGLWPMGHLPTGLMLCDFEIFRKMPYPWFVPGLRGQMRDDVYFCHQARKLGYEIWCDHDLTKDVVHIGEQPLPWFSPEQLKPVEVRGAQIDNDAAAEAGRQRAALTKAAFEKQAQELQAQVPASRAAA